MLRVPLLRNRSSLALNERDRDFATVTRTGERLFTQTPGLSHMAKKAAGMPVQRQIPPFAAESFQAWVKKREVQHQAGPSVILWPDTFNNYFFPETAQAALEVLESLGYNVQVPMQHLCCGRPLYDYGFLDRAKTYLKRILDAMEPAIQAGTPMVVLEPSCCSVFRDELNGLMPDSPRAQRLKENTFTLSEFLQKKAPNFQAPKIERKALVQGHCHHKAIMRLNDEEAVMKQLGLDFQVLNSGCCGMAGSFGYEKDKYDISVKCGERSLLPAVRRESLATIIMADGFSCREQISQQTNRHALHLAEVIQMAREREFRSLYPESNLVERRRTSLRRARRRALSALAGIAIGGAILLKMMQKRS